MKGAEGDAKAQVLAAEAAAKKRVDHATGDAARFEQTAAAYEEAPEVTRTRLILETMEIVLAPINKVIRGSEWRGRHDLLFFNADGMTPKPPPAQQGPGTEGEQKAE